MSSCTTVACQSICGLTSHSLIRVAAPSGLAVRRTTHCSYHRDGTGSWRTTCDRASNNDNSARSALRQTSRRLNRRRRLGLVNHLERRIGEVRAGSSGYIWHLNEAGWRLAEQRPIRMTDTEDTSSATLDDDAIASTQQRRHRHAEPSHAFLAHTLAITEARVTSNAPSTTPAEISPWYALSPPAGAAGRLQVAAWHGSNPTLEIITRTAGGDEDHWLLEIDLGTENPARLITKCHDYQAHVNTEIHQTRYGYYPQVVWVMNEQRHEEWLRQHIADDPRLTTALFKAIGSEEELEIIVQAEL